MSRLAKPFLGRWRIVHMDPWDRDFLDLIEPAFIAFDDGGLGAFGFGAVTGQLDCRYDKAGVAFTWQGHDDADQSCGRGRPSLAPDGSLEGWAASEPNDASSGEDCAIQGSVKGLGEGHRWIDVPCSLNGHVLACENANGDWKVTPGTGPWAQGEEVCKAMDAAYFFSVPATAKANLALTKVKPAGATVWLNYTDQAQEGKWIGKHRWNSWTCGKGQSCIQNANNPHFAAEDKLVSPDGATTELMQADCNFVIYSGGSPIWASDTHGQSSGCQFVFQGDGNLVIYRPDGAPIWASNTDGNGDGLTLHMQDNGNLVMHGAAKQVVWSTSSRN